MLLTPIYSNPNNPFLGIGYSEFIKEKENFYGIQIDYIVPNSSADKNNLKKGDIIYMVDYQNLATSNTTEEFKSYIKNEKDINDQLVLHILRRDLIVGKNIDGDFIDVEHTLDDVVAEVNLIQPNNSLIFKFKKNIKQDIVKLNLERKPLILASTPNISLDLFPSIDYMGPYYTELLDSLRIYDGFGSHFEELEKHQLYNEFWDDGLRFPLIRYLHVHYDKLPAFTGLLHQELSTISINDVDILQQRLSDSIAEVTTYPYPKTTIFTDHYDFILKIITESKVLLNNALKNLTQENRDFILAKTPIIINQLEKSFIIAGNEEISDHELATYFSLLNKVDTAGLFHGYATLLKLWNRDWLDDLKSAVNSLAMIDSTIDGLTGKIHFSEETEHGTLVISSGEDNTYTKNIPFIIDIGGNDTYRNNAAGSTKDAPISFVIDLDGNDIYSSSELYSQGSGILGYGLIIDYKGDDLYRASRLGQGIGIFGCGGLIDYYGDDSYVAQDFSQGLALGGKSFVIDYYGNDSYSAALFAQGVGLTKGLGSLFDFYGNDTYFLGARNLNSYGTEGVFKGAGQGFGFGFRHISSGGIGFLYDYKGNDHYESGNFSQGTGYYYGLGMLFDDYGHDTHLGSRYSIGSAAHSALGILKNRRGDDTYKTIFGSSLAIAWDNSNAFLLDEEGDDIYNCLDRSFCLAQADHNSFALFNDKNGSDIYHALFEKPEPTNAYNGGKSFSVFIDEGGSKDTYFGDLSLNNEAKGPVKSFLFLDLKSSLQKYLRKL